MVPWMVKQGPLDFMRNYLFMLEQWAGETLTLSVMEEGALLRLQNWALKNESALPHDVRECYRIARATTPAERKAVARVLREMMERKPEGFTTRAIENAISRWQQIEPAQVAKREADAERQRQWRKKQQETARLARANGVAVPFGASSQELDSFIAANVGNKPGSVDNSDAVTTDVTRDERGMSDVTHGANRKVTEKEGLSLSEDYVFSESEPGAREGRGGGLGAVSPTEAGLVCREMRRVGLVGVNPSHPSLLALIAAGASRDHFAAVAASAVARGRPFAWVLATVEGQLVDGGRSATRLADANHAEAASVMAQLAPSVVAKR